MPPVSQLGCHGIDHGQHQNHRRDQGIQQLQPGEVEGKEASKSRGGCSPRYTGFYLAYHAAKYGHNLGYKHQEQYHGTMHSEGEPAKWLAYQLAPGPEQAQSHGIGRGTLAGILRLRPQSHGITKHAHASVHYHAPCLQHKPAPAE